jgi:exopolyphosphatase/guanosine-5'-triphosphate,3'-diphosphate pyrophosphatase
MLAQCAEKWKLNSSFSGSMLEWSALLHEIGLDISHDGFQKHGAYIAENADLPGFPRAEQKYLAFLIANQRRQVDTDLCEELPAKWQQESLRLAILLRLAVLLNRSRSREALPNIALEVAENSLALNFPQGWLEQNPLTRADLEREKDYLSDLRYELRINPV